MKYKAKNCHDMNLELLELFTFDTDHFCGKRSMSSGAPIFVKISYCVVVGMKKKRILQEIGPQTHFGTCLGDSKQVFVWSNSGAHHFIKFQKTKKF